MLKKPRLLSRVCDCILIKFLKTFFLRAGFLLYIFFIFYLTVLRLFLQAFGAMGYSNSSLCLMIAIFSSSVKTDLENFCCLVLRLNIYEKKMTWEPSSLNLFFTALRNPCRNLIQHRSFTSLLILPLSLALALALALALSLSLSLSLSSSSSSSLYSQESNVNLRLTLVDTVGYGDQINKGDSFDSIVEYIDNQFEAYLQVNIDPLKISCSQR